MGDVGLCVCGESGDVGEGVFWSAFTLGRWVNWRGKQNPPFWLWMEWMDAYDTPPTPPQQHAPYLVILCLNLQDYCLLICLAMSWPCLSFSRFMFGARGVEEGVQVAFISGPGHTDRGRVGKRTCVERGPLGRRIGICSTPAGFYASFIGLLAWEE